METPDPNIMPEINLGIMDRVRNAGQFLARVLTVQQLASHGDHIPSWLEPADTGAEAMLDQALDYDQLETD